jgi:hypothetical protein
MLPYPSSELNDLLRDPVSFVAELQAQREARIDRSVKLHYSAAFWFANCFKPVSYEEFERQFEV